MERAERKNTVIASISDQGLSEKLEKDIAKLQTGALFIAVWLLIALFSAISLTLVVGAYLTDNVQREIFVQVVAFCVSVLIIKPLVDQFNNKKSKEVLRVIRENSHLIEQSLGVLSKDMQIMKEDLKNKNDLNQLQMIEVDQYPDDFSDNIESLRTTDFEQINTMKSKTKEYFQILKLINKVFIGPDYYYRKINQINKSQKQKLKD